MFGKKSEEKPQKHIPLVTMNYFPGREFEVITLLGTQLTKAADANPITAAESLIAAAREYDADAIIGFRCNAFTNSVNWVTLSAYGTAIRFID